MIAQLVRSACARSGHTLLVAGLVACMSLAAGTVKADINLSTGINVISQVDQIWHLTSPALDSMDLKTLDQGFPGDVWVADSADSKWLVPVYYGQLNAPPSGSEPLIDYVYTTTFELTAADLAVAKLSGRWLSDNNTISILLNGASIAPGSNSVANSYTAWTDLTGDGSGSFVVGTNTLSFHVYNQPQDSGNPTGFRFEGGVATAVPEPASLVMGALSTVALGGFSWKRRLARRAV
jgi:hypothetical protein